MKNIDVSEIATRLTNIHEPLRLEEIESLVAERFNGRSIPLENLANEIMLMVSELIGEIRSQDKKFMIDLVQTVVNELQKKE